MIGKQMTNEEKLDAIYEMTRENHEILLSIRRQQYLAGFLRFLYWLAVLGALGGAYYYVRPLVVSISENREKIGKTVNDLNKMRDSLPETKLINGVVRMFSASSTEEESTTGTVKSAQ